MELFYDPRDDPYYENRVALQRIRADLPEGGAEAMLDRARARLPDLARWLEENARELLERT